MMRSFLALTITTVAAIALARAAAPTAERVEIVKAEDAPPGPVGRTARPVARDQRADAARPAWLPEWAQLGVVLPAPPGARMNPHIPEGPAQTLPFTGFDPPAFYPTGFIPDNLRARDLTGDGYPEIVTGNQQSDDASVLINRGDGTFLPEIRLPGTPFARDADGGDFDENGLGDLVVAFQGPRPDTGAVGGAVAVFFSLEPGVFADPLYLPAGAEPHTLAVGDLNGDTIPDIATVTQASSELVILISDGDGGFEPQRRFRTGPVPQDLKLGDLDADGDLDAVAGIGFSVGGQNVFAIHINLGDGTFEPAIFVPIISVSFKLAVADFTGDGRSDILIPKIATALTIFESIDGRAFIERGPFELIPTGIVDAESGSLNMQRATDFAVGFPPFAGPLRSAVFFNDGAGNLPGPRIDINVGTNVGFFTLGDVDLDGDDDIITGRVNDISVVLNRLFSPDAPDLTGDGIINGSDIASILKDFGAPCPSGCAPDLNHDGMVNGQDISVVLNRFGEALPPKAGARARVEDGVRFDAAAPAHVFPLLPNGARAVRAGDLDRDGMLDLVALGADTRPGALRLVVYHGSPDGFEPVYKDYFGMPGADPVLDAGFADLSGDSTPDLAVLAGAGDRLDVFPVSIESGKVIVLESVITRLPAPTDSFIAAIRAARALLRPAWAVRP